MQTRDPSDYPTRILLCVSGMTPQIVTETLYYLVVERRPAFVSTAIHVVTTLEGAEKIKGKLLLPGEGHLLRLCADYGIDPAAITLDDSTLHLITNADGVQLADTRTEQDNVAAADTIAEVVRRLTDVEDSAIYASIAGGRKTMSFIMGYAMSLFGRPQDRLSHVLVEPEALERPGSGFFYKPPVTLDEAAGLTTEQATITLGEVPFLRLRDGVPRALLDGNRSFRETVELAQRALQPPELVLDLKRSRVRCSGITLDLSRINCAFLAWFARRAQGGQDEILRSRWQDAEVEEFLAVYREVLGSEMAGDLVEAEEALLRDRRKNVRRSIQAFFKARAESLQPPGRPQAGAGGGAGGAPGGRISAPRQGF